MNNPFPSNKAIEKALELQICLDKNDEGQMYGVLVCIEGFLKAFSGKYHGRWNVEGWAPSLIDADVYEKLNSEMDIKIHRLTEEINNGENTEKLQKERQKTVLQSLSLYFDMHIIPSVDGKNYYLNEIFKSYPPAGSGDCCAPKLLGQAFRLGWHPEGMAEFYYGKDSQNRKCGEFYGPCDSRCRPILHFQLGLDIVYNDGYLIIVNKDSGLLSVPGKITSDSVETRIRRLFPSVPRQCAVHRLDMDTSGLLVLACNPEIHRAMNIEFMNHAVKKKYIGLVDGIVKKEEGRIDLPLRADINNRPHQIYDSVNGKNCITDWKRLTVINGKTLIEFSPLTGRTHQLRVHCAHEMGLGFPITGDRLYGEKGPRLILHASEIEFIHPVTGQKVCFSSCPDWTY